MGINYFVLLHFLTVFFINHCSFHGYSQDRFDRKKADWFHQSVEENGVYGVGSKKALEFLKSKKLKPITITVGILDGGIDINHEALKNSIWINSDEKAENGIDDDRNGYVDDIKGWNFIGGADGKNISNDTHESTRIVNKWAPVFHSRNKEKNLNNIRRMPKKYQIYLKAREEWVKGYSKATEEIKEEENINIMYFLNRLRVYTDTMKLTPEVIDKRFKEEDGNEEIRSPLFFLIEENPSFYGKTMDEIIKDVKENFDDREKELKKDFLFSYNIEFDPRKTVGDNFKNKAERFYGNNNVKGPASLHGTHIAGIIAATQINEKGMYGIANNIAKIMSVRTVPDGDERDKDVANAIRYAVDNGAKIINMSFGKGFSPEKELVWDAIKYADSKGVLMFHGAGNENEDVDLGYSYPSNFKGESMAPFVNNWITVGASTQNKRRVKARFSNYGTARVDIFAPGVEIYSTIPNNKYGYLQGTSMASPVAAGCAALLWAYFPQLTASQVKDLLLETANSVDQELEVGDERDKRNFETLSVSGGIIDVNKAVRLAYDRYGKKGEH